MSGATRVKAVRAANAWAKTDDPHDGVVAVFMDEGGYWSTQVDVPYDVAVQLADQLRLLTKTTD